MICMVKCTWAAISLTRNINFLQQRKKAASDIPLEPSKRHSMTEDEKVALWMPKGTATATTDAVSASRAASLNSNSNNASDG